MRHGKGKPPERRRPAPESKIIDLNAATLDQIAKVSGVGPRLAEAIVAQRPLRGWDDLKTMPGMSQGLMKQLRYSGVRIGPFLRQVSGQ
jgi:DNA uptake protein ComE-like DNA-binding protein